MSKINNNIIVNADGSDGIIKFYEYNTGSGALNLTSQIIFSNTGDIKFTNNTSGTTERMTVLNNGNVGIGNDTPAQKLDVNGTIQTTGFKLTTGVGNNKVLTSDENGVGTWQAASSCA